MSKSLLIWNLKFLTPNDYGSFDVGRYNFAPVYIPQSEKNPFRRQVITYRVTFSGEQENTLVRRGGKIMPHRLARTGRNRKFIEDILLLISLLTGSNATLNIYRDFQHFPIGAMNTTEPFCINYKHLHRTLPSCVAKLRDPIWMKKYHNAFHIIHFNNSANISTIEPRFLSYVTIWELLFSLENSEKESMNLNEIMTFIMHKFFGSSLKFSGDNPCVFYLIRNQLAHNGTWPLSGNRLKHAPTQFKSMSLETSNRYMRLFGQLTYLMVLMTLDIPLDAILRRLSVFDIGTYLGELTKTGMVSRFH